MSLHTIILGLMSLRGRGVRKHNEHAGIVLWTFCSWLGKLIQNTVNNSKPLSTKEYKELNGLLFGISGHGHFLCVNVELSIHICRKHARDFV